MHRVDLCKKVIHRFGEVLHVVFVCRAILCLMWRYFDKAFFKFLFGFIAIIAISFIILLATNYYQQKTTTQGGLDQTASGGQ